MISLESRYSGNNNPVDAMHRFIPFIREQRLKIELLLFSAKTMSLAAVLGIDAAVGVGNLLLSRCLPQSC